MAKIKYDIKYKFLSKKTGTPTGGVGCVVIEAESETNAIALLRLKHPSVDCAIVSVATKK